MSDNVIDLVDYMNRPKDDEPSATRGANFYHEALRVGPEETGRHMALLSYTERKKTLADMFEYVGFCRELFTAFDQLHMSLPHPADALKGEPA